MRSRSPLLGAVVAALVAASCGSSGSSSAHSAPSSSVSSPHATSPVTSPPVTYYLALGDSLAVGVQPDPTGNSGPTDQSYPDYLYNSARSTHPGLQLVKMGCSGERTQTMINGGICQYPGGSQLAAAITFLRSHQGATAFVTLDMGTNNVLNCASSGSVDPRCVTSGDNDVKAQLPQILQQLRSAAGPQVRIVGLNVYDPFLSRYLSGDTGRQQAAESLAASTALNATLAPIYQTAGDPLADVAATFSSTDSSPTQLAGHGTVPTNVARICQWTWMCAAAPVGPNIHANATGYQMMAAAAEPLV